MVLQRPRERRFVDDRPACRVDQIGRALHPRQRFLVDQMTRLRQQGNVQRHDVGRVQQAIEGDVFGAGQVDIARLRVDDAHAEDGRPRGNGASDATDADEPELLPVQLGAEHEIERPAFPRAAADNALAFSKPARDGENQRPGEVGNRLGQHVGRVGDDDTARRRVSDVDVVEADRNIGDDLQLRRGVDHRAIDCVGQQRHERILVSDPRAELVRCNGRVAAIEIHAACRFELREDRRGKTPRDEDPRGLLHWRPLSVHKRDSNRNDCSARSARSW